MHRGRLIEAIQRQLVHKEYESQEAYQSRWDKIWDDELCAKFKDQTSPDFWIWNDDFFTAAITDLQYIAQLIGVKEVKK